MNLCIAVDFDGVICESAWPEIGAVKPRIVRALLDAQDAGIDLVLYTCRTAQALADAREICALLGLRFAAVNENLPWRIASYGGDCRKISADLYIEDRAAGYSDDAAVLAIEALIERRKGEDR